MPARSVCLVTLSLSEAGPGRLGGQASVTDIYHAMPCQGCKLALNSVLSGLSSVQFGLRCGGCASVLFL